MCTDFEQPNQGQNLSLVDHALAWASSGFFVFPCKRGGKAPACPNGLHDATNDPETIRALWSDPEFNIAVAPARSGCWVLDVDPPLGAVTLRELEASHGALPATLTIRTPRGGSHYWFEGVCPSSVQKLGPKLDTRGSGGYVLVPPSAGYTYINDADIAPGPAWVAAQLAAVSTATAAPSQVSLDLGENVERAVALLRSYVEIGHVAVEGSGGDDLTYKVACELINVGLSAEKALDVLLAEWDPHCNPPWGADALAIKVANAAEYMQNDAGVWSVAPGADIFKHLTKHGEPQKVNGRFYPRDETEQEQRPPPTWLLPGLLPDASTVMMFGPSGQYKSFLALDLSLVLASGAPGWGTETREPVPVVYVTPEGTRGIERHRRPAWREARGITEPLPFYTVDTMPLIGRPHEVVELIEAIKQRAVKPRLVVLDTLARAMAGLNENDAQDIGEFIQAIEEMKRHLGCTVMVLHHTGKEEGRGARGSSAIGAGLDTTIEVKSNTETRVAVVHIRKQKDADLPSLPWTFQGRSIGATLVFDQVDTSAHRAAITADPFSTIRVGAALREFAGAVTAQVLATHL